MTDIAPSEAKIQAEAFTAGAPVSESAGQALGGATNQCLANLLPVASIISTLLDETTFQTETSSSWVLCDGRGVVGSRYQALTGNANLPDLRGMFLRGKNNGRSDGKQNPGGDLVLGTYQDHEIQSHTHPIPGYGAGGGASYVVNQDDSIYRSTVSTSASGGNETRPTNITVNHMIRIN